MPLRLSRSLLLDSLFATVLVFVLCGLFSLLVFNLGLLDPVHSALHHVNEEFENQVEPLMPTAVKPPASPICLIDVGQADRAALATLLTTLARQQPRVVALDVVFDQNPQPADARLRQALQRLATQNRLVMASWLTIDGEKGHETTTVNTSDSLFRVAPVGYTNFVTENNGADLVRRYLPRLGTSAAGDTLSFSAQTVALAAPDRWQHYRVDLTNEVPARILFQSNPNAFRRVPAEALTDTTEQLPLLRDAIVLVGSMAGLTDPYKAEDVHNVPLGEGTRLSGMEIHAHIIAMILQGVYVKHVSDKWLWVGSFVLCFLFMIGFTYWFKEHHLSFHVVFKILQLLFAAIVVLVSIQLLERSRIEMNVLPLLIPVALSVDVLYIYEWLSLKGSAWLKRHRKVAKAFGLLGYESYFNHTHTHEDAHNTATAATTDAAARPDVRPV